MKKLVIDFGSATTKIYMPGCGVVLTEATCVAVEEYEEEGEKRLGIKAYGNKARALAGRSAVTTRIINPVFEGDIVHESLAAHLLSYFLEKIEIPPRKTRHAEIMFIIPCGAKEELKAKYARLAEACGVEMIHFTLTPFAAVLGHNVVVGESTPMFSLDIGATVTNIAAFSQDGMICGLNLNLGGSNIDVHLIDDLAENSGFKIGALTAERLKNSVGSLLHDDNKMMVVDGTDVATGAPSSLAVNSGMILPIITAYIDKILEYVRLVISKLQPDVASAVMRGGIYLTGGVIKMDGLPAYIEDKLQIPVNLPEEPQLAAVIGGGSIITDYELSERLATYN